MSANFKTHMFGGFDRQDVIRYIEKTAKDSQERIKALEQENEALRTEKEQLEVAVQTLRAEKEQAEAAVQALRTQTEQIRHEEEERTSAQQQFEDAQTQVTALAKENAALSARNESLRQMNEEYRRLKERIADIEISAHRRTEEFRAETIERLHEIIEEQRAWCQERRGQYAYMNERLLGDIHRAEAILETSDVSGFDRMMNELQEFQDSLQER